MSIAPAKVKKFSPTEEAATLKVYLGTTRNDRTPQGVTSAQPPEPLPKKENPRQETRHEPEKGEQSRQRRRATTG